MGQHEGRYESGGNFLTLKFDTKTMNQDNFRQVKEPINSDLYAVQDKEYKWGVVDEDENVIALCKLNLWYQFY